ncbi:MAG: hypothetical protein HZC42_02825 [Candidatus Eisenbacteria bacterium]|nr:hypothetical protein [Candidatus Eisenbacteria bacterium]
MAHRRRTHAVPIGPVTATFVSGVHRVAADVDGVPIWFETRDTPLTAAPEAFGSAFLLPALHQGVRLALADPVDPAWLANVGELMRIARRWWRYPVLVPEVAASSAAAAHGTAAANGVALFFSGGVDSFYSLLKSGEMPDRLVTVQGFDVALDDPARMAAVETTLRAVAEARGLRALVVRTNLRSHPLVQAMAWERSHGGALAAVAHVLGDGVSEVLISSSIARDRTKPWGSHWETDPLFSSSRVRLREIGMELRRRQKLPLIAGEPLVRRHLRVCWENRSPAGNCSHCGKCVITRLLLADCGTLDAFPGFEGSATLARDLDALQSYSTSLHTLTDLAASARLDPEVLRATRALLERSRHAQNPLVRARRAVLRKVLEWTRGGRP